MRDEAADLFAFQDDSPGSKYFSGAEKQNWYPKGIQKTVKPLECACKKLPVSPPSLLESSGSVSNGAISGIFLRLECQPYPLWSGFSGESLTMHDLYYQAKLEALRIEEVPC